ncbi:hypothetical protein W97_05331 [Coniosporium apollinis CBS 100218]|uniref:Thioesterase domain-containing protein n=1 Tax=Coniosporium apollinis (strain CBS 100218) TaxID=1168221 RepID=R7YW91_CONA1|nr:uncharacterized protein W97_05331 [Coniosporium apollinis CBS 100218]EON66088.1 hypothetical protein W97_05331 [Coniosporium apollinis CBS 100218]
MDPIELLQGSANGPLTPLFLVHAVSGLALPYLALGPLDKTDCRPVYGITSPIYSSPIYKLPSSLDDVARRYVTRIRREVQPEGPYLLGGWSMGGMIAVRMAKVLQEMGEKVLHVIMIDSANPESFPAFKSKEAHDAMTNTMFDAITRRITPPPSAETDTFFPSPISEEDVAFESDAVDLANLLTLMRNHISNGLRIISEAKPSTSSKTRYETEVTLIKCTSFVAPPRRYGVKKPVIHCKTMNWKTKDFDSFQTILFSGDHDGAFDERYVGELTAIMESILSTVN